jgi:hypothetical protein
MKNETDALNKAITVLQEQRVKDLELLKDHLHVTYESLKPINFIKSTLNEVVSSPEIQSNMANNAIGLGTGFLLKKLWVGKSQSPIKRLLGTLVQFAVANAVAKHADSIKYVGKNILRRLFNHRRESKKVFHYNGNDLLDNGSKK